MWNRQNLPIRGVALLLGLVACEGRPLNRGSTARPVTASPPGDAWSLERTRRQQALDAYLVAHSAELQAFVDTPLGHSGFPVIMMREFPGLFPSLWAPGGDPTLSVLGLGANPWNPNAVLPMGFGYSLNQPPLVPFTQIGVQVANLTCGACHTGRVEGPDGRLIALVGAPNAQFDASSFFGALEATVEQPGFDAPTFSSAIDRRPAGTVYDDQAMAGQERLERFLFSIAGGTIVDRVRSGIRDNATKRARLAQRSYAAANAPNFRDRTPGRADAFGLTMAQFVDDTTASALPAEPAITDIMSVWRQRDRATSHWGGEMRPGVWPVVAAEFAVAGASDIVNVENIDDQTSFLADLPPPPYPFEVDMVRAERGRALFAANCSACHQAGATTVYAADDVGTDPSRSHAFTPYTLTRFNQALKDACRSPALCGDKEGTIVSSQPGYVATPLDGLWARAPYLHNGSVPTLYHLLVPAERPVTFERGNPAYDREKVGFVWDTASPSTTTYDTRKLGAHNTGHDTARYLGTVDWANAPEALADLLEYLKTL